MLYRAKHEAQRGVVAPLQRISDLRRAHYSTETLDSDSAMKQTPTTFIWALSNMKSRACSVTASNRKSDSAYITFEGASDRIMDEPALGAGG